MLGMGLGSDIFASLIHYSTLLLLIFATYAFGKRFLPSPGGWIAAAMIVGMPMMLIWGGFAYTDIAWALFQFLAFALLLIWIQENESKYLVLSGMMQGLALGSKYLAIAGTGILAIFIVYFSWRGKKSTIRFLKTVKNLFNFGAAAILIALPWYLKNILWTGNPIFPFYFPQNIVSPTELNLVMDYAKSFGTEKKWFDYMLLPFTLFIKSTKFSTYFGPIDYPNPLFLIVISYPWIKQKIIGKYRLILDVMFNLTVLQFIAWAMGSQQTRFLMPLYPCLSILASAVLLSLSEIRKKLRWDRILAFGAVGGMIIFSLIMMFQYFIQIQPYKVVLGSTSKSDFLSSVMVDYSVINYINKQLPENAKVMTPWYGKGYYCNSKCYPDVGPSKWTGLFQEL